MTSRGRRGARCVPRRVEARGRLGRRRVDPDLLSPAAVTAAALSLPPPAGTTAAALVPARSRSRPRPLSSSSPPVRGRRSACRLLPHVAGRSEGRRRSRTAAVRVRGCERRRKAGSLAGGSDPSRRLDVTPMTWLGIDIGCISLKAALVGRADDIELYEQLLRDHTALFQTPADGLTPGRRPAAARRRLSAHQGEPERGRPAPPRRPASRPARRRHRRRARHGLRRPPRGRGARGRVRERVQGHRRGVAALHPRRRHRLRDGRRDLQVHPPRAGRRRRPVGIVDYQTNGDCAAGTGSFLDQQAGRLQLRGRGRRRRSRSAAERAGQIAGRCSVFAKSDMIHAQQKGYTPAGGAARAVRRGGAELPRRRRRRASTVEPPVAFIGGVAGQRGRRARRCARPSSWTTAT